MTRLFVGNLPSALTRAELRGMFAAYGPVSAADVVMDTETGRSRGFGFVEMEWQAHATNAIRSLDGTTLDGRAIKVDRAKPRNDGGSRGNPQQGWAVVGEGRHRW